jgi:hypothetical protein
LIVTKYTLTESLAIMMEHIRHNRLWFQ